MSSIRSIRSTIRDANTGETFWHDLKSLGRSLTPNGIQKRKRHAANFRRDAHLSVSLWTGALSMESANVGERIAELDAAIKCLHEGRNEAAKSKAQTVAQRDLLRFIFEGQAVVLEEAKTLLALRYFSEELKDSTTLKLPKRFEDLDDIRGMEAKDLRDSLMERVKNKRRKWHREGFIAGALTLAGGAIIGVGELVPTIFNHAVDIIGGVIFIGGGVDRFRDEFREAYKQMKDSVDTIKDFFGSTKSTTLVVGLDEILKREIK